MAHQACKRRFSFRIDTRPVQQYSPRGIHDGHKGFPRGAYRGRSLRFSRTEGGILQVHLINPSHVSFGIGVITPRWLYVLAQATPARFGDPVITDETLELLDPSTISKGDIVGIGIHTGNALRGYELGRLARAAGAMVVFGGIHATL